jgi:hypothetical protein
MKILFSAIFMTVFASLAQGSGFSCAENVGPFGGDLHGFKLVPVANGFFELTFTRANADGSNANTTSIAKDLQCDFSKLDPIVVECQGEKEIFPEKHLSNYLLVAKTVSTIKTRYADALFTSYDMAIAAPQLSDEQLKGMADFDVTGNGLNPNLANRSFKASIPVRNGLSGCKAL